MTRSTTPSREALISVCIFMLSITTSGSPARTCRPGSTWTATTVPGIGAVETLQAWRRFDFRSQCSVRFGAPCWVRSGAQAMTIGELKAGAGQGFADMLFLKLDR